MTNLKNRKKAHFAEILADIVWKERGQKKYVESLFYNISFCFSRANKINERP